MNIDLNQEEIQESVINKCVREIMGNDYDTLEMQISTQVQSLVNEAVAKNIEDAVEKHLTDAFSKALDESISPVNTWGEPTGETATLKVMIHNRAREFWNEKVDGAGKRSQYGGQPRHEKMLGDVMREEFTTAISQNIVNIAGALKDSVRKGFYAQIDKGLSDIFKVHSQEEQNRTTTRLNNNIKRAKS